MLKIRCAREAMAVNGEEKNTEYRDAVLKVYEYHSEGSKRLGEETVYFDATIFSDFVSIVILDTDINENFVYKRDVIIHTDDLSDTYLCATKIVGSKPVLL